MRCNGADGLSITQALSTKYTHINHPKKEFMYKKNDIKYDIQRGWIFLVPPITEASGGIELSFEPEAEENNSNNAGQKHPLVRHSQEVSNHLDLLELHHKMQQVELGLVSHHRAGL